MRIISGKTARSMMIRIVPEELLQKQYTGWFPRLLTHDNTAATIDECGRHWMIEAYGISTYE